MQWMFSTNLMNPIDSILWTAYGEHSQKVTTIECLLKVYSKRHMKMQCDVWWSPDRGKQGLNPTSHCNTSNNGKKSNQEIK